MFFQAAADFHQVRAAMVFDSEFLPTKRATTIPVPDMLKYGAPVVRRTVYAGHELPDSGYYSHCDIKPIKFALVLLLLSRPEDDNKERKQSFKAVMRIQTKNGGQDESQNRAT